MAAKLEEVGAPVYFIEEQAGGHGVSDPLMQPDIIADRMTFLIDTLK
jgi:prolyl oligopeptidase